ncbi:hypothetical protein CJF31_00011830 [Rutstroemia sp. NJR-2017a BVV2]|nr:hypothetical protein CJF31_00011830 [Rutstroemia sp. NJR-2017a BVV2]
MIAITCSLSLVEVEDGFIADGLNSVLVPITQLAEDGAIQWHFRPKKVEGSRKRLLYSEVLRDIGTWYQVPEINRLTESRCFLGWVRQASILLGTAEFSGTEIKLSQTDKCPKVCSKKSYAFNFGTGGMGMVTGTVSINLTKAAMISSVVNPIDKDIYDMIEDSRDESILLHDAGRKTSYYLPQTNFVLFMAQSISRNRKYEIIDGDEPTELIMAKLDPDGGAHAYEAIKANLARKIKYRHSGTSGDQHCISKLFTAIWHSLDKVKNELKNATDGFRTAKQAEPKYIFGVEYMEFLKMESSMEIKRTQVDQPWAFLTNYHPMAIFCKDLPAPIAPFRLDHICSTYREIPSKRNVLVATARTVAEFLKRTEEGLCPNVAWHSKKILIEVHDFEKKVAINHVQYLKHDSSPKSNTNLRKQVDEHLGGCFIFDGSRPQPCNCYTESSKSSLTNGYEKQIPQISSRPLLDTITDTAAESSYKCTNSKSDRAYTIASPSETNASHPKSQGLATSNNSNGSVNLVRMKIESSRNLGQHEIRDIHDIQTCGQISSSTSSNVKHTGQPLIEQPKESQPPPIEPRAWVHSTQSPRGVRTIERSANLRSIFQEEQAATQ